MFKFNGGNGAIICDYCRIIVKEPALESEKDCMDLCDTCLRKETCPICFHFPCQCGKYHWSEEHNELLEDMLGE